MVLGAFVTYVSRSSCASRPRTSRAFLRAGADFGGVSSSSAVLLAGCRFGRPSLGWLLDPAGEFTSDIFMNFCRRWSTDIYGIPTEGHWGNPVERYIQVAKSFLRRFRLQYPQIGIRMACKACAYAINETGVKAGFNAHQRHLGGSLRLPSALDSHATAMLEEDGHVLGRVRRELRRRVHRRVARAVEQVAPLRLELDRLAAVELHRVAPLALVLLVPVEVGGDAALAVHVGAARAVDLHPLVHEGGDLCVRGRDGGKGYE